MQVRGTAPTLLPGDPSCAPGHIVMVESVMTLLRTLHTNDAWNASINQSILTRLGDVSRLTEMMSSEHTKLDPATTDPQKLSHAPPGREYHSSLVDIKLDEEFVRDEVVESKSLGDMTIDMTDKKEQLHSGS